MLFRSLRIIVAMYMSGGEHGDAAHDDEHTEVGAVAPGGALAISVPATVWFALVVTVAVTVLVGVLPGLVTALADDAVPVLLRAAG